MPLVRVKISVALNQEIKNCGPGRQYHYQQIVLKHSGLKEAEKAPAAFGKKAEPIDTAVYYAAVVFGEEGRKAAIDKRVKTLAIENVYEPSEVEQLPNRGKVAEKPFAACPFSSVFKPGQGDAEKTGRNPHNEEPFASAAAMFGDMLSRMGLNRVHEKVLDRVLEKTQHKGHAGKDHNGDRHCPENIAVVLIFMRVSRLSVPVMMLSLDPAFGQQNVENQTEAVIGGHNSP
jgi:hypothetical protein